MTSVLAPALGSAWADADRWDREYRDVRSIPSSHRFAPSHALRQLESLLHVGDGARVLDAGAGGGRHALHFADRGCRVDAVDVSPIACDLLAERVDGLTSSRGSVSVLHGAVGATSLPDERYDLVLDAYVSCHLLVDNDRLEYLDALLGVVRPGGVVFTCVMGAEDEFYAGHRAGPAELDLATDPANGVTKLLQHRESFTQSLSALDASGVATTCTFSDAVDGRMYRREVLAAIVRRH